MPSEKENFTVDETDKFLSGWHYITQVSNMGNPIPYSESDSKIYVHYLRALDYLKSKMETILSYQDIQELRNWVENNKENEPKGNKVVDLDMFLINVLTKYRIALSQTKEFVKNAFFACDLDGNGSINLNEFLTLYRHLESDKFVLTKVLKVFELEADIIGDDSEKCLSFEKFTGMCLQSQLFLEKSQRKFIDIYEEYEIENKFQELKENWKEEKQNILFKIDNLKPYIEKDTFKKWKEIVVSLQDRIFQKYQLFQDEISLKNYQDNNEENKEIQKITQKDYLSICMSILIAHKLLVSELQRLIEVGQNEEINFNEDEEGDNNFYTEN